MDCIQPSQYPRSLFFASCLRCRSVGFVDLLLATQFAFSSAEAAQNWCIKLKLFSLQTLILKPVIWNESTILCAMFLESSCHLPSPVCTRHIYRFPLFTTADTSSCNASVFSPPVQIPTISHYIIEVCLALGMWTVHDSKFRSRPFHKAELINSIFQCSGTLFTS